MSPFEQKITSLFSGATRAKAAEIADQGTDTTAVVDVESVIGSEDIEKKKKKT